MEQNNNGAPMDQDQTIREPETVQEPVDETAQEAVQPKKSGSAGLIIGLIAAIAVIVVLIVMLVTGKGNASEEPVIPAEETAEETVEEAEDETGEETAEEAVEAAEDLNAFVPTVSYIREADYFDEAALAEVIASCGDSTLNLQKLAFYYWQEYYATVNMYGSYISFLMDPYSRLDGQQYSETLSWDQQFMDAAIDAYSTCAAAAQKAKANGFELPESDRETLDNIPAKIDEVAVGYGFESGDDYIAQGFGPYCDVESYQAFMEEYRLGLAYLSHMLEEQEVTEDDLLNYYEENKESYDASGLEKDDTSMVSIRHVLIQPEAVELTEEDEGYEEAVQAAKDAAKATAESLYADWKEGEMTEETFSQLAIDNSSDSSAADGGLISDIAPGQTVENFDAWCFDASRQPGDHAIVETEYGYHIIYFVEQTGESYWHSVISSDYANARYLKLCEDVKIEYPAESDLTKAAVYAVNIGA